MMKIKHIHKILVLGVALTLLLSQGVSQAAAETLDQQAAAADTTIPYMPPDPATLKTKAIKQKVDIRFSGADDKSIEVNYEASPVDPELDRPSTRIITSRHFPLTTLDQLFAVGDYIKASEGSTNEDIAAKILLILHVADSLNVTMDAKYFNGTSSHYESSNEVKPGGTETSPEGDKPQPSEQPQPAASPEPSAKPQPVASPKPSAQPQPKEPSQQMDVTMKVGNADHSFQNKKPFITNGRMMVPLRELLISLGVPNDNKHIVWDGKEQTIQIVKDNKQLQLKIGSPSIWSKDKLLSNLDVQPVIVDGSTYLPARGVAEALGYQVDYDAASKTLIMNEIASK
jgi:hypothetical protein